MTTDPTPTRYPCEFCKGGHPDDIGGSYDRQRCEADWCFKEINEIEKRMHAGEALEDDPATLRRLTRQLERARYVGD